MPEIKGYIGYENKQLGLLVTKALDENPQWEIINIERDEPEKGRVSLYVTSGVRIRG